MEPNAPSTSSEHPVQFSVEYPDRDLNRLTTAFRLILAIPILVLVATLGGGAWGGSGDEASRGAAVGAGGLLFLPPLLMIVFRQKYPRWWYDWNLELLRFTNRVGVYLALMDDRYPSTEERQAVSLDFPYPHAKEGLNRWLPLVKWLLAVPHYSCSFSSSLADSWRCSSPGSRSSSRAATHEVSSTFLRGSDAGTTVSSPMRSYW